MNKLKVWIVAIIVVLLVGAGGWTAYQATAQKNSLNHSHAFAYKTKDHLSWFKVTETKGKVTGHLNEKFVKESFLEPELFEDQYDLSGKVIESGYEFQVKQGKENVTYEVRFSGKDLSVKKQGEKKSKIYKAIDQKKLTTYQKAIQDRYDELEYTAEFRQDQYRRNFTEKFNAAYGYIYTAQDGSYQLFLTIDEALREGEWSGSLLVTTVPGVDCKPYKETTYEAFGLANGYTFHMFTDPLVKDMQKSIKGTVDAEAKVIEIPFWKKGGMLKLKVVTEKQYKKQVEAFKKQAEEKKK
ncbi:hypothetical protein [Bacillus sp. NPDC077027]|uniref:hypothetical protein n=1 Tax=Bacillus sp. NPDC077027 TaxID=3390548 RepID=UPI003CFDE14E